MAEYRLGPGAQRDLDAIFDYTIAHWDTAQAMRYIDRIQAACADLAEAPRQAQGCDDIRPGYRRRGVESTSFISGRRATESPLSASCTGAWT